MVDPMVVKYVGEATTVAEMRDTDTISWCFHKKAENWFGFALRYATAAITGIEARSRSGNWHFPRFHSHSMELICQHFSQSTVNI